MIYNFEIVLNFRLRALDLAVFNEQKLAKREKFLAEEVKILEDSKKSIDQQVFQKLQAERTKVKLEVRKEVESAVRFELKDLQEQNVEKEQKLAVSQKVTLEFRKKIRELDEMRKNQELKKRFL